MKTNTILGKATKLFVSVFFMTALGVSANVDTTVHTRLYQGDRLGTVSPSPFVSSQEIEDFAEEDDRYHLQKDLEEKKIREIYNLSNLKLLNQGVWNWKTGYPPTLVKILSRQEGSVAILISKQGPDAFHILIANGTEYKDPQKALFSTDFTLKEHRTTVFGFNDQDGRPCFLSFHRSKIHPHSVSAPGTAQTTKNVLPDYPPQALAQGIEGNVAFVTKVREDGTPDMGSLEGIDGHPLLLEASMNAFRASKVEGLPQKKGFSPKRILIVIMYRIAKAKSDNIDAKTEMVKYKESAQYQSIKKRLEEESGDSWIMKVLLIKGVYQPPAV